jgi:solute:Na+ symporter, SSS family
MSLSPILFSDGKIAGYASPFHSYLSIVFGTTTIFIVGSLAGIFINKIAHFKQPVRR